MRILRPTPGERRRRRRIGLLGASVVALTLVAGTSSAGGFTLAIANVHGWLPDWHRSVVNTRTEAVTVAKRYNVVVGQSKVYRPYLGAMHAARPHVVVAAYKSSISAGGENYTFVSRNHPSWFLRDRYGNRLHDSYGAYLINPKSLGVRRWTAKVAKRAQADGFDAFFLDSLGTYGLEAFHGTPIDPSTGVAFTPKTWLAATRGLAKRVNAAVAIPVIGNGLRDGSTYFSSSATYHLLDVLQAGEFEACFRAATFSASWFPSTTSWLRQVKALSSVQRRGRRALCWVKIYSSASSAQQQQWHDFALASFLLAQRGKAYFYFQGSTSENALSTWGDKSIRIGRPLTGRLASGNIYYRVYTHGMVAVNPTGISGLMQLSSSYMLAGHAISSLTLPAHGGVVLTSS
jgi:hypothetical protein